MEETTGTAVTSENTWLTDAAKKGAILGGIHAIIYLVLYAVAPEKLVGLAYAFVAICVTAIYVIVNGIGYRKEIGGYMEYGAAFKFLFVMLIVNGVLGVILSVVLTLVNPSFPEILANASIDTSVYWAAKFGAPEEALDQVREKADIADLTARYSVSGLIKSFGIGILIYAVVASIFALIVRKRQPEAW